MSQRRQVSFNGMVRPLGGLWHRFAFVLLILAAFTIMLVGKADIVIVNRLKGEIADAVTPILDVVSRPTQALAELIDQTRQWRDLQAQNARLREENKRLRRWICRDTDPETVTRDDLRRLCAGLNATPRKCLGYRTPAEVFRANIIGHGHRTEKLSRRPKSHLG